MGLYLIQGLVNQGDVAGLARRSQGLADEIEEQIAVWRVVPDIAGKDLCLADEAGLIGTAGLHRHAVNLALDRPATVAGDMVPDNLFGTQGTGNGTPLV